MAFRKDETGVAQTAANTAATLVGAMLTAGVITEKDEAIGTFDVIRASTFADLRLVVQSDNEVFAAAEAAAPAKSYAKSNGGGGSGDAGAVVIEYGALKGKGLSIAEAYKLTAAEFSALTNGGYDKDGPTYIQWMTGNDKNPFMQKKSVAFLEGIRSGSDA